MKVMIGVYYIHANTVRRKQKKISNTVHRGLKAVKKHKYTGTSTYICTAQQVFFE